MGTITDFSDLIAVGTASTAQHIEFSVDNRVGSAAATIGAALQTISIWRYNKTNGAQGVAPTSVTAPDRTTLGAIGQANATPGKELKLLSMMAMASFAPGGAVTLYDRLLHIGGLNATTITAQTVGGSITRNTGGENNQIWVEINSQIGSTARTITASYTNQAGTASKTTVAVNFGGTGYREAERMFRLPLADGDTGVQSVQNVTISASTGGAGDFGVVILRPIAQVFMAGPGFGASRDFVSDSTPVTIPEDACLALYFSAMASSPARFDFSLHLAEK